MFAYSIREWNVPGKYGPHGELLSFLIQQEPESMPGSETLSTFLNADIRTSLFSADVLKKCGEDGCHALDLGDEWKLAVQRAQCGKVRAKPGQKTNSVSSINFRESNVCNEALHVSGLYRPGDKISLFLKDWELAKVAFGIR